MVIWQCSDAILVTFVGSYGYILMQFLQHLWVARATLFVNTHGELFLNMQVDTPKVVVTTLTGS